MNPEARLKMAAVEYLLEKNPEVARIFDLMESVGQ